MTHLGSEFTHQSQKFRHYVKQITHKWRSFYTLFHITITYLIRGISQNKKLSNSCFHQFDSVLALLTLISFSFLVRICCRKYTANIMIMYVLIINRLSPRGYLASHKYLQLKLSINDNEFPSEYKFSTESVCDWCWLCRGRRQSRAKPDATNLSSSCGMSPRIYIIFTFFFTFQVL